LRTQAVTSSTNRNGARRCQLGGAFSARGGLGDVGLRNLVIFAQVKAPEIDGGTAQRADQSPVGISNEISILIAVNFPFHK